MRRNAIKLSPRSVLIAALVENLYKRRLSFMCNGNRYTFNDERHLLNTLDKLRRENFNQKSDNVTYLFFDTETTGKPINYKAPMTDLNNWPRVIQLAWAQYSADGTEIAKSCDLIKPDGWVVPQEPFWIKHGYSTEKNEASGLPISLALDVFAAAAQEAETMVAHNMAFDYKVLGAEMIRANMKVGKKLDKICTMESATPFCRLPGGYRGYKYPNLTELHMKLFGVGFDGAHDAMADVRACARSFFKLKELGVPMVGML